MSAEERLQAGIQGRIQRSEAISDNDVRREGSVFYVMSQTNNKEYLVRMIQSHVTCGCVSAGDCPHSYSCNCEDRSKPCKHIYKVHSLAANSSAKGESVHHQTSFSEI